MSRAVPITILVGLVSLAAPASAKGTNGRFDVLWWSHDLEVRSRGFDLDEGADDVGFRGELFWGRYGIAAGRYASDLDDLGDVDAMNADFVWKFENPGGDAYLGLLAGWEQVDLGLRRLDGTAEGLRIGLQGQVGFFYGRVAWMPDLGDFEDRSLRATNIEGREWEVGAQLNVTSHLRVSAGWRSFELDLDVSVSGSDANGSLDAKGWIAGLAYYF